jgi:hypothetical protein
MADFVLTTSQDTNLNLTQNNGGSVPVDPVPLSSLGGGVPLSAMWWIDQATTVALAARNGLPGSPYATVLEAVTAHPEGGTFILVPADYSTEVIPALDGGAPEGWTFIGGDLGTWNPGLVGGVAPNDLLPATMIPNLTIGDGAVEDTIRIELRSVRLSNFLANTAGFLFLTDVNVQNGCFIEAGGVDLVQLRAVRTYFNGGGVGGAGLGNCDFESCGFFGSQTVVTAGTVVQVARCYGETAFNFTGAAGTVSLDIWSRALSASAISIINGGKQVQGYGPTESLQNPSLPSITGVDIQDQIDSIIAAGVANGLWTDDR